MIIWIIKILRRLHDTFYKQNALSLAFRQRVGVNGARWLAGKNDNAFKASAFAGAFFCVDLLLVVVFCGEKQKKFSKSLDEKGENG